MSSSHGRAGVLIVGFVLLLASWAVAPAAGTGTPPVTDTGTTGVDDDWYSDAAATGDTRDTAGDTRDTRDAATRDTAVDTRDTRDTATRDTAGDTRVTRDTAGDTRVTRDTAGDTRDTAGDTRVTRDTAGDIRVTRDTAGDTRDTAATVDTRDTAGDTRDTAATGDTRDTRDIAADTRDTAVPTSASATGDNPVSPEPDVTLDRDVGLPSEADPVDVGTMADHRADGPVSRGPDTTVRPAGMLREANPAPRLRPPQWPSPTGDGEPVGGTAAGAGPPPHDGPLGEGVGIGVSGGLGALAGAIAARSGFPSVDLRLGLELVEVLGGGVLLVADAGSTAVDPIVRLWYPLRYSQHDGSEPLENDTRASLYEAVRAAPGSSISSLAERAGIPLSTARYHARVLAAEDVVREANVLGRQRIYPYETEDLGLTAALSEDATTAILTAIARLEAPCVSDLATELDLDVSTVSHHLSRLDDLDLLEREKAGRTTVNRLAPGVEERLVVTRESVVVAEPGREQGEELRADGNGLSTRGDD